MAKYLVRYVLPQHVLNDNDLNQQDLCFTQCFKGFSRLAGLGGFYCRPCNAARTEPIWIWYIGVEVSERHARTTGTDAIGWVRRWFRRHAKGDAKHYGQRSVFFAIENGEFETVSP